MTQLLIDISVSNVKDSGLLDSRNSMRVRYDDNRLDRVQIEHLLELIKYHLSDEELCNLFLRLKRNKH